MNQISPDDFLDCQETLKSLDEWIDNHKEKISPIKLSLIFIMIGTETAYIHLPNEKMIPCIIEKGIALGLQSAAKYNSKMDE